MHAKRTIIAGDKSSYMEVGHLRLEGKNRDIGRYLAGLARQDLGVSKVPWTNAEATRAQKSFLEEHWPGHLERSLGVGDVYGVDRDDTSIDTSFLYYDWAVPGCTVAFYPPATTQRGHGIFARNYDFTTGSAAELLPLGPRSGVSAERVFKDGSDRPATARPFIIESHPDVGYASIFICCYELLGGATDGVNAEGLAVALLADTETLHHAYKPLGINGVGISEIQLVRWLLETCATAEEARHKLRQVPQFYIHVPCHYAIADKSGDAFVWELGHSHEPMLVEGDAQEVLTVTNNLLGPHRVRREETIAESVSRRAKLCATIAKEPRPCAFDSIRAANEAVDAEAPVGEGQYAALTPARTLWHSFYDLNRLELEVDFYLGDDPKGQIRRSAVRIFRLATS